MEWQFVTEFFETNNRSHLQRSISTINCLTLEDGPDWLPHKFGKIEHYHPIPTRAQVSKQPYYATGKHCRCTVNLKTLKTYRHTLLVYSSCNKNRKFTVALTNTVSVIGALPFCYVIVSSNNFLLVLLLVLREGILNSLNLAYKFVSGHK